MKKETHIIDPKKVCPICRKLKKYYCEIGCISCKNMMKRLKKVR